MSKNRVPYIAFPTSCSLHRGIQIKVGMLDDITWFRFTAPLGLELVNPCLCLGYSSGPQKMPG